MIKIAEKIGKKQIRKRIEKKIKRIEKIKIMPRKRRIGKISKKFILFFDEISQKDIALVGGKNASLGEMISLGIPIPKGFAITSEAYKYFIKSSNLESKIQDILKKTNTRNVKQLKKSGKKIRSLIKRAKMPEDLERGILSAFKKLGFRYVAVRSSATAEDLRQASFAGQQESFLNVSEKELIQRVKDCFASLFTDRAISYRVDKGFDHFKIFMAVGVQELINAKASGVLFTNEPDSGHKNFIYINASYGLGDYVVQGKVDPDEYLVFKPLKVIISKKCGKKKIMEILKGKGVGKKKVPKEKQMQFVLTDEEILELADYAMAIENHYKIPQDIEWAKDSKLHILQSRPETVHRGEEKLILKKFKLKEKTKILLKGLAIGRGISSGSVNIIKNVKDIHKFKGGILVTRQTDPDWEPIMKFASGIITEIGGKTSHAAIVSRELGVPCIVGVENAIKILRNGQKITIDCSTEEGKIWQGELKFELKEEKIEKIPKTRTKILVNISQAEVAFDVSQLPVDGVGLAREEFIIANINEHPLRMIAQGRDDVYIQKLAEGIAKIASAFYPRTVILRTSDLKSSEYRNLKGGERYEPKEENPMIGWRGASRYINPLFEPAFRLECRAIKHVKEKMKLTNLIPMIPFCRSPEEAKKVLTIMKTEGLVKPIYVMAELPSNFLLAKNFAKYFDGFSIGSNDLTQLVLGIDRESELLSQLFDERNLAVKKLISHLIKIAHEKNRVVSICGEAPSNFPDFVEFLVRNKIDSISVEPDMALQVKLQVARLEKKLGKHLKYS